MNIRDLEYVIAIADHGNLSRAAEACHVSAPTLSIQLAKLEAYLGVTLFERTNKKVSPTAVGHDIIAMARDIIRQSRTLRDTAREGQNPFAGTLRLGAFPTLAPYYLPHIVQPLTASFPKLKLRLIEEKSPVLLEQLRNHELDAALLSVPVTEKDLSFAPLFDDPFYLACPERHPLAHKKTLDPAALAHEKLLLLEDGHCLRDQALEFCHSAEAGEDQEFRATSMETLRQMVAAGAGITLIPRLACTPSHGVRYVPISTTHAPKRVIGLVWRKSTVRLQLFEATTQLLRELGLPSALSQQPGA